MWTLDKKGHRDLPLGGCRDGPWLSGAAGPSLAGTGSGGRVRRIRGSGPQLPRGSEPGVEAVAAGGSS